MENSASIDIDEVVNILNPNSALDKRGSSDLKRVEDGPDESRSKVGL